MVIIIFIILFLLINAILIGRYFYNFALNPKTKKYMKFIKKENTEEEKRQKEERMNWLSKNAKDVYIQSSNNGNLKLHAYEIEKNKELDTWVIIIHGYTNNGIEMVDYTKEFFNENYNNLIIDLRGHGLSEGKYIGMGWHDRLDVIDWVNYLIGKNKNCKIILYGISMGAATVMMTTGENLQQNVKIAICDSGYTSVWDEFSYQLKRIFKLPKFPVMYIANIYCKIKAGYFLKEASSIKQLKECKIPILFIHGSDDTFVPFYMLEELFKVVKSKKEKLIIDGAKHTESARINHKLYYDTVKRFINKYI